MRTINLSNTKLLKQNCDLSNEINLSSHFPQFIRKYFIMFFSNINNYVYYHDDNEKILVSASEYSKKIHYICDVENFHIINVYGDQMKYITISTENSYIYIIQGGNTITIVEDTNRIEIQNNKLLRSEVYTWDVTSENDVVLSIKSKIYGEVYKFDGKPHFIHDREEEFTSGLINEMLDLYK